MAKVIMCFPPCLSPKGQPQIGQNRQYQYFKDPTYIYPIIPATFITMLLTEPGHEVLWLDGVAENLSDEDFGKCLIQMHPHYIVLEANTMLVKRYYDFINSTKANLPDIKIILAGEHATALYDEVKENCKADFIIKGGKWYKEAFKIITEKEWGDKDLPIIDRNISRWWLYAYDNGNYKYLPATYTMVAQDCWYRPTKPCSFCTWVHYHPENHIRSVDNFIQEIEGLVNMGFREFFDDSGTFPVGKWLKEFCDKMIAKDYEIDGKEVALGDVIAWGCNMRFGALQADDFKMMAKAGCRFILWGFESANQSTLDKINKGYTTQEVTQDLIRSRMNGIWNHLTVMMGYPWETLEEEYRTHKMVKWLLLNDWAASMQSTIFMPYPGTSAFKEYKEQGLLLTEDWDKWDMTNEVVKLKYPFKEALKLQKKYYEISYHPKFIFNKLSKIKTKDDIMFYGRLAKKVVNRFALIE